MSKSKQFIESTLVIDRYLRDCQFVSPLAESASTTHTPPTPSEVRDLFDYLAGKGVAATIIGSVAVMHYLKDGHEFRPTNDLDLFVPVSDDVISRIEPPPGWARDRTSPGVPSWISPGGGYVDFMAAGHMFPGGSRLQRNVQTDPTSGLYPVATPADLFRLKLNSYRDRDTIDLVSLARAIGGVPSDAALGALDDTASENLAQIRQWLKLRPSGAYGS